MGSAPTLPVDRSLRRALRRFDADRLRWLDEASDLGPIAGLRLGPVTAWVVTDPSLARTMLIADAARWRRPSALVTPVRLGVGENLFTQPERTWRRVQPGLAPPLRSRSLAPSLESLREILADEVRALPFGVDVDVTALMQRTVLIAGSWVLFGERLDRGVADELVVHQRAVVDWVGERIGRVSGVLPIAVGAGAPEMRAHRRALVEHGRRIVARARNEPTTAFMSALLSSAPESSRHEDALVGQVLGMLLAGTETTAAGLVWALVHASNHSDEWARVRTDPDQARAFLWETLRLTPPVWGIPRTPRRAARELSVDGVAQRVRPGAVVTVYLRRMHRDPAVWDDPTAFRPERHGGDASSPALIPFGLGPRGCIGQHLALGELTQLVPLLANHADVSIESEVIEDPHFALRPGHDLRARLTPPSERGPRA